MARFIDSDKLICQVQNNDKYGTITKQMFISLLQNSETEDVAPVVHAHWIKLYNHIKCSNCGVVFFNQPSDKFKTYCSKCGAKMDEVINDA